MKPRRKNDTGRGLARWGWIKGYLAPTLKYLGVTSEEFDHIVSGGDQHIEQGRETSETESVPSIGITINGTFYTPVGSPPAGDGYICIVFAFEPQTVEIDPLSSPPSYTFNGVITMTTLPYWALTNGFNQRPSVNPDGTVASAGFVVIPVAYRDGQELTVFIRGNITYNTVGTLGIDAFLS